MAPSARELAPKATEGVRVRKEEHVDMTSEKVKMSQLPPPLTRSPSLRREAYAAVIQK